MPVCLNAKEEQCVNNVMENNRNPLRAECLPSGHLSHELLFGPSHSCSSFYCSSFYCSSFYVVILIIHQSSFYGRRPLLFSVKYYSPLNAFTENFRLFTASIISVSRLNKMGQFENF